MANSIAKLIELNLSLVRVTVSALFFSFISLVFLMLVLEHSIVNFQCFQSLLLFYFLWLGMRYFSDFFSDFSLCFLVYCFDVIYFSSSGLYAFSVLFYFYFVQPFLQDNLRKQSFEFVFMHFYVLISAVLVNVVLNISVSISRYFLIAFSV